MKSSKVPREPPVLALCENQKSSIDRGTSPKKGGHKHNPSSRWSQKHSLYQKGRDELKELYDHHVYRDPELGEVIALKESVLLDVDSGEVLRRGISYQRKFDVLR